MSLSWYFDTLHIFVLLDFIPWSTPSLFSTILYVRSALISVVLATVSLLPTSLTTPTNLHVVFVVRGVVIIDHTNTVICMYRAPRSIQPPFFAYLFLSQEHHMQELRVWFPPPPTRYCRSHYRSIIDWLSMSSDVLWSTLPPCISFVDLRYQTRFHSPLPYPICAVSYNSTHPTWFIDIIRPLPPTNSVPSWLSIDLRLRAYYCTLSTPSPLERER